MRSRHALALGLLLAAGCQFNPPGECAVTADCEAGLTCQGGVCTGCQGDASCGSWQACSATQRCVSLAGACSGDGECAAWEACGADHACAVKPGQCGGAADCGSWESCTAHACQALPGQCSGQADCPWYLACRADLAHTCGPGTFDPAAVVLWGTLDAASCSAGGVAPLEHPEQVRVGLDCAGSLAPAALGPAGDLAYTAVAGGRRGVSRFVPDAATFSVSWVLPATPLLDDEVLVATGACGGAGVDHWLRQAGSGDVLAACPAAGGFDYLDQLGVLRFNGPRVLAWTAGGARLTGAAGGFQVVGADDVARPVTGLGSSVVVVAVRTHGEAFWVVDGAGFGAPRRYSVSAAGQASLDGVFAAVPAGVAVEAPSAAAAVLDGAGVLHQRGSDGTSDVVVRRPLAPAPASVPYREADAPAGANAPGAAAFLPYLRLHGGPLVTGP